MLKIQELQEMSTEELQAKEMDLSRELFEIRNEWKASKRVEASHRLGQKRKDRARVLTLLRQKQINTAE